MGEKIRETNILEAETGRMNLRREIWERTLGNEIQGRKNMGIQNWRYIEEK